MGEIGYDRREFLYVLQFWEIRAIIRGYRARTRGMWEAARLNAFFIMCSMADMKNAGIHTDRDLVKFGWEDDDVEPGDQPSDEDVERLREMIREENEKLNQMNHDKE